MREELHRRLAALNGGELAEVPTEERVKDRPPSSGAKGRSRAGKTDREKISASSDSKERERVVTPGTLFSGCLDLFTPFSSNGTGGADLSELLPGYDCDRGIHGRHYCVETRLHDAPEWRSLGDGFRGGQEAPSSGSRSRLAAHPPDRLLFFDIETSGLGEAVVFLIGLMAWDGDHFVIRQLLARGDHEERAILAESAEIFGRAGALVSFNGKSFDAPFVRNRMIRNGLPPCPEPDHIDLLHPARQRWSRVYANCRLQTLEAHVCGRPRVGDIPSREIPAVYLRYTRDGDPRPLLPILHHNLLDLIVMAELMLVLRQE